MPSNTEIQKQIGYAIDENLPYCIDNINKEDLSVTYLTPKTKSEIKQDEEDDENPFA